MHETVFQHHLNNNHTYTLKSESHWVHYQLAVCVSCRKGLTVGIVKQEVLKQHEAQSQLKGDSFTT